jgi:hypothetical protein
MAVPRPLRRGEVAAPGSREIVVVKSPSVTTMYFRRTPQKSCRGNLVAGSAPIDTVMRQALFHIG